MVSNQSGLGVPKRLEKPVYPFSAGSRLRNSLRATRSCSGTQLNQHTNLAAICSSLAGLYRDVVVWAVMLLLLLGGESAACELHSARRPLCTLRTTSQSHPARARSTAAAASPPQ
jgi:hypothetical protein